MGGNAMVQAVRSIIVLCSLILPLPATAQALSIDEKVRYIVEFSGVEESLDKGFESSRPIMIDEIKKACDKITPELADYIADIATDEFKQMKPEFITFIVDLYKREWSEEEIGALHDFYKSPAGASLIKKMLKFNEAIQPQIQAFVNAQYVPKITERITKDERFRKALSP
jgi:hypothetical protein